MDKLSLVSFLNIHFKVRKVIVITFPIRTNWLIKWINGAEWKLWDKLSINIVIFLKVGMKMCISTSTLIKLFLSCLIKKKLSLVKNSSPLLNCILLKDPRIHLSKEFSIWLFNVWKNVSHNKEKNLFLTFNLLEEGLASLQHPIGYKENWLKMILMVMGQKWKFSLQTKDLKEEFQVGWEQQ